MSQDRANWPRCLLWHGSLTCLPALLVHLWLSLLVIWPVNGLGVPLRYYPLPDGTLWCLEWEQADFEDMADSVPDHPNICFAGCREAIPHLDVEVSGERESLLVPLVLSLRKMNDMLRMSTGNSRVAPVSSPLFLAICRRSKERNIEELFLRFEPFSAFTLASIT